MNVERLGKLEELRRLKRQNALLSYRPYKKQLEFHQNGSWRERMFMAGNQLGKTLSAGAEVACHATGLYPDWWNGRKIVKPTRGWVAGVTAESTRDNPQRILLGQVGDFGTGMIPHSCIEKTSAARGVPDAIETILVKHVSGGTSQITFKAYSDGREKWQGETLDYVWYDEEPPIDIYTEGLTRTNATGGFVMITETPLLGMSEVVRQFLGTNDVSRKVIFMEIDDVDHYSEKQKLEIVNSYPEHEREARAKGIPYLGSGRVFPVEESLIVIDPIKIPEHWFQIGGMDFGYDPHPAALVGCAYDADQDTFYILKEYRRTKAVIAEVASASKSVGKIPFAWPHDGWIKDKSSGIQVAQLFRQEGVQMLSEHAQFPDERKMGLEAGVMEMLSRMTTGRWKVFSTCQGWLEEFRLYHRKDGEIVKEFDDLLSASRYAMMMRRYGRQVQALPPPSDRYRKRNHRYTTWMAN